MPTDYIPAMTQEILTEANTIGTMPITEDADLHIEPENLP